MTPGHAERLVGFMGRAFVVRDGVRDDVPSGTNVVAKALRTRGYGQPTFGDWLEILASDEPGHEFEIDVIRPRNLRAEEKQKRRERHRF